MNRFLLAILPHPEGDHRSSLIHRPALTTYVLVLGLFYLSLNLCRSYVPGVLGFASNIFVQEVVDDTNTERQKNGLETLKFDEKLAKAAEEKARDMFTDNYWAHVAPDGTEPWDFINNSGYEYIYAGENLAKDFQNSSDVVTAWMNSPSHRQNILNKNYKDIGIAVVNGVLNGYETTLVVQMFGNEIPVTLAEKPETQTLPAQSTTPPPTVPSTTAQVPVQNPVEQAVPTKTVAQVPQEGPHPEVMSEARTGHWQVLETPSQMRFDVFTLTRTLTLLLGLIVLMFFLIDEFFAWRWRIVRVSGHGFAHLCLLLLLLGVTWLMQPGIIV